MFDLIPIGSIVELKDKREVMIIGYNPNKVNESEQFDYIICMPSGFDKVKEKLVLNKDYFYIKKEDITNIIYIGYNDREFDLYKAFHDEIISQVQSKDIKEIDIKEIIKEVTDKYKKGENKSE